MFSGRSRTLPRAPSLASVVPQVQGNQTDTVGKAIASLLVPGVTVAIRNAYMGLPYKAEHTDFGPLEEGVIVLDTETTGLAFRDCELIEIAAARLVGKGVEERFSTFVDPGHPIPPDIRALTHIRDIDVAGAPSPQEAVSLLADFVGGMPVIAHNASFDRGFVEKAPGGREVSELWVDSLALSRIALPMLSSHRLSDMARAFGKDSVTHRAMDDVDALAGMWPIILSGLMELPQELMRRLSQMHEDVSWQFRPILAHIATMQEPRPFLLKAIRSSLLSDAAGRGTARAKGTGPTARTSGADEVRAAFSKGGLVSGMYDSFEERPDQVEMALEVTSALAEGTHRAIEAGTGVGKSMAYLLPEVRYAQESGVTAGIATKTNALTDQLISHELPALDDALPQGVSFTSLKGYDHYLCLHRLDYASTVELPCADEGSRSHSATRSDMLTALAVSYAFACQAVEGDIDALGIRWRSVPRPMLTTTPAECLRNKCPYFPAECFVHGARRRASESDVVVTNHALLLRDIDMEGRILPPIRHWVVDEAHSFEDEARRQWAREFSGDAAREGFARLGGTKAGAIHSIMSRLASREASTLPLRLLTKTSAAAARASVSVSELVEALHALGGQVGKGGGYGTIQLWIDGELRATKGWEALLGAASVVEARLEELAKDVRETVEALSEQDASLAADLTEAGGFADELLVTLRLIVLGEDENYFYFAELFRKRREMGSERLVAQRLDIGSELGRRWLPEMESVIFTSATMAVGESFEHFDHAVGLDVEGAGAHRDVRLRSSFDFERNMSVIVAQDMPLPGSPRYLSALEELLFDIHRAMGGSTLTLFTNRRDMEAAHQGLEPRLAQAGIRLLCQERGVSPRRLRERFLADKSCSLLALRSFWEGFDAAGDTLRCVVIPKLPFASPQDPLVRERELREDRSWWKHSLPEAIIAVKQAAGRLIRSSDDSGVLVLADSRLVTKRYGAQFTRSLPNPNATRLDRANVGRYLELWRRSRRG